jgi:hypothetical protein
MSEFLGTGGGLLLLLLLLFGEDMVVVGNWEAEMLRM